MVAPRRQLLTAPASAGLPTLVIKHASQSWVAGTFGHVAIAVWRTETGLPQIQLCGAMMAALAKDHGQIGLVQIVEETCERLDGRGRTAVADMLAGGRKYICCSVVVFDGVGFRAAAIRGVVTGLTLLARPSFPHHVFAAVPLATAFLARHFEVEGGDAGVESFGRGLSAAVASARSTTAEMP